MARCFFCSSAVEASREAFSNACARCSDRLFRPVDPQVAFDNVDPAFRDIRDAIEFGDLPSPGHHVSVDVMELARMAKWRATEGSFERHKATYWYARLFRHNCAIARRDAA
jgi:hypothetical protein